LKLIAIDVEKFCDVSIKNYVIQGELKKKISKIPNYFGVGFTHKKTPAFSSMCVFVLCWNSLNGGSVYLQTQFVLFRKGKKNHYKLDMIFRSGICIAVVVSQHAHKPSPTQTNLYMHSVIQIKQI
jgi:hypothetical protein